jgi:hypothetical protein
MIFWSAVVVVAGGLGIWGITARAGKAKAEKQASCTQHLRNLSVWMGFYAKNNKRGELPHETGRAFFRAMKDGIGAEWNEEFLTCPYGGKYRGPKRDLNDPNAYQQSDPIACDDPARHPDGINVLYRDGRVEFAEKDSSKYKRALELTQD